MVGTKGQRVIEDIHEVCDKHSESPSIVLSYLGAFGDSEVTAILNEVIEEVSIRKGVKRTVQDLVREGAYEKFVKA